MTGDGVRTASERSTAADGGKGAVEPETAAQSTVTEDPGYALSAWSDHEHERLRRQAERFAPFTRRLLTRAGIKPGMRVLDVGCGPGDVSFLVAELVGDRSRSTRLLSACVMTPARSSQS